MLAMAPPFLCRFPRFLRGTWTAEVVVQGGGGNGNGFLVTTTPSQGGLVGRYYENVTDSIDVKSQFVFQVTCCGPIFFALLFLFSVPLTPAAQVTMSDSSSGNVPLPARLLRFIERPNGASPADSMLQLRIGVPLDDQSLPRALISDDDAAVLLSDSAEKQLQAAAFQFRMSLHNKM